MIVIATLFGVLQSCSDESSMDGGKGPEFAKDPITFSTSIRVGGNASGSLTRASGINWAADDEIGVYMLDENGAIPADIIGDGNVQYKTAVAGATGTFEAVGTPLYFPADGSTVDFIAYYPYASALTDHKVAVDVASQADLPAIDLLYSTGASGSKTSTTVELGFKHAMSFLVFEIENQTEQNFDDMVITLQGMPTTADFNLADASYDNHGANADIDIPVQSVDADNSKGEAIIIPMADASVASVNFTLPGAALSYTYDFVDGQTFVTGMKYTFKFILKPGGQIEAVADGDIEDWGDGGTVTEELDPDGTGPKGTQADPFTLDMIQEKVGETAWMTGVVKGYAEVGVTRAASRNLLLGETAEAALEECALIMLEGNQFEDWFDLDANPSLMGATVKFQGTIAEGTQVLVVINDITDQEGGIEPATPSEYDTIQEVMATFTSGSTVGDFTIKAVVISDRANSNIHEKNLIISDGTAAGSGLALRFNDAAHAFDAGDELVIPLSTGTFGEYMGLKQVTFAATPEIEKVGTDVSVAPVEITDADQLINYMSMLVTVKGAQAVTTGGKMNATHAFSAAGKEFAVYNTTYNTFVAEDVPTGKGDLTGIVTMGGDAQVSPRSAADFAGLTGTRDGVIDLKNAVISPVSGVAGEPFAGKITVAFDNQPVAGEVTYSVDSEAAWFTNIAGATTSLPQGSGTFEIDITGTPTEAGTADFTITIGAVTVEATLTVRDGGTAAPEEYFKETCGEAGGKVKIGTYSDWDMIAPIVYSDSYGKADIRTTSTLDPHVWMPSKLTNGDANPSQLLISNIPSTYTDITLSVDIVAGAKDTPMTDVLQIKCNGTLIENQPSGATGQAYATYTFAIPDNTSTIEFFCTGTNAQGFRLDNITLVGTPQ